MKKIYILVILLFFQNILFSQSIDKIEAIVGSEIAAWKTAAEAIVKKLTADLVGKSMTGELVKGDPYSYNSKRKPIATTIKSIDVDLKCDLFVEEAFVVLVLFVLTKTSTY